MIDFKWTIPLRDDLIILSAVKMIRYELGWLHILPQ